MYIETQARSIVKTASYRLWGTLTTAAIVYFLTGRLNVALAAGGIELVAKLGVYFVHERAWNSIRFGRTEVQPVVVWFTGLSGSGKSTLAHALMQRLRAKGLKTEHLDGDEIRSLIPNTGFSRQERDAHVRRVGLLARYLQKNGVFVIASLISPYESSRREVRSLCGKFIEVHLTTPLEECERRDAKGLYARARRGELKNFTGIDDPFEAPTSSELAFDTSRIRAEDAVDQIVARIESHLPGWA